MLTIGKRCSGAVLAVLFTVAAQCGPAFSITWEYKYEGNILTQSEPGEEPVPPGYTIPAFSGIMWINELQVPGKTLVNATLSGSLASEEKWTSIPWVDRFTIYHAPVGYAMFEIRTDAERNIVSWSFNIADGPPDIVISDTRDSYYLPSTGIFRAPPGVWSQPTPVPVPPAILLLLTTWGLTWLGGSAFRLAGKRLTS